MNVPEELRYINKSQGKKELSQLVERCFKQLGHYRTVQLMTRNGHYVVRTRKGYYANP